MSYQDQAMSMVYRTLDMPNKEAYKFVTNRLFNTPIPRTEQMRWRDWAWRFRQAQMKSRKAEKRERNRKLWTILHNKPASGRSARYPRKPPADDPPDGQAG